jgi:hypothetical protein
MRPVHLIRLFIIIFSLRSFASFALSPGVRYPASTCPIESKTAGSELGGDFTPFPWGKEISIGHSALQGVWAPTSITCGTYFVFELTKSNSINQRIVEVKQFDPETCDILSSGIGYESDRIFYVSMVGKTGRSFDLTVRAFNRKDLKSEADMGGGDQIDFHFSRRPFVVATLYPRQKWSRRISYPLAKVSESIRYECSNGDALPQGR